MEMPSLIDVKNTFKDVSNEKLRLPIILFIFFILSGCSKDPISLIVPNKSIDITAPTLSYEDKLNLSYGSNPYQKYDLFLPNVRNTRNPVIIILHGGAWRLGDKSTFNFLVNDLKTKRVNCAIVNANYRLAVAPSWGVTYQQQLDDIDKLLHKICADAKELGIGTKFYLVGISAGGHLSLLYTSIADQDHLVSGVCGVVPPVDLSSQPMREGIIGADVQNIIGKTYVKAPEEYQRASPAFQYLRRKVPTILFYGGKDVLVTNEQCTSAKLLISSRLNCNEYYFYPDQNHDWSVWSETSDKIISFAERNL